MTTVLTSAGEADVGLVPMRCAFCSGCASMCSAARPHSPLTCEVLEHYFLAGPTRFERASCSFGGCCVSVTPRPQEEIQLWPTKGERGEGSPGGAPVPRELFASGPLPWRGLARTYQRKPGFWRIQIALGPLPTLFRVGIGQCAHGRDERRTRRGFAPERHLESAGREHW